MVTDTSRLRASIFEQTGIAIDEKDPIIAVIAAFSRESEALGNRLLRKTSSVRVVIASAAAGLLFAAVSSWATWEVAQSQARAERAEWLRQQADPRAAAVLRSDQGKAGLRLAELGVASMLERCKGRPSWRLVGGYCIPVTADGRPDGFRVRD